MATTIQLFPFQKLASNLVDKIKQNPSGYIALGGKGVAALSKFAGVDIQKFLDSRDAKKRLRTLLVLFGMCFAKTGEVQINVDEKLVQSIIRSAGSLFNNCITTRFLDKVKNKLGATTNDRIATVVAYAKKRKLGEYLSQYMSHSSLSAVAEGRSAGGGTEENLNVISALKLENANLRKKVEKASTHSGIDTLLVERIQESIDEIIPELKFVKEKWNGKTSFSKNIGATAVLHISDWHIGAKENVDGFNQFNYRIACERVKRLTEKMIGWTEMHRNMYNIKELVIIATGDMISGDIHDELIRTNEFSVPEQCVKSATLISKMVNELSSHFERVRVEYIVADNHSRTTQKIQFGDGTNSYNYIVGTMSQLMLQKNAGVQFNLYPEIKKIIRVEGLRYLITHGNCFRGGAYGIPYYSIKRNVGAEAIARMNLEDGAHFDKIVAGHFHTPMRDCFVEMTGCLSSTTAFDHAAGRYCRACQTAWVVSKDNEIDLCEFWLS